MELTPVRTFAFAAFAAAIATSTADGASRKRVPDGPQCPTAGMHVVSASRALDGGAFATADGREVKLAGIVPPGRDGNPATPIEAQAAKDALDDLLKNGTVSLAEAANTDRYGRAVAQVFVDDMWVQENLLRRGLVRAAPDDASAMCTKRLLAAEGEARAAKSGAWGTRAFAILDARSIKTRPGSFQIVEGTVTTSAVNRGRAYVNFGADYRTDFTITVQQPDMAAFRRARLDLRKLAGKRLRVRGWIDFYNGPEMEIATPAAIEVLNSETPAIE